MTTNPITGLVQVMGEPDTGKTTFSISDCAPQDIAFFDDDLKTQPIADMLQENGTPFGAYYNLTKMSLGMREIEYHNLVMSLIDALPRNRFARVVFDPFTRFENTFQPIVQKNPGKFREFYSPMGTIKGAQQWQASFDYEAIILDKLLQVAPLVVLTAHLKDQSIGAVKTGKEVPDCKKPVIEKSRMRLWLRHNTQNPAPIGLVLKRLSKISVKGSLQVVNVLPRKVTPCTWERLTEYWNNPIGDNTPSDDETPNAFELSILDGVLTDDQKDALHINRVEADKKPEPAPQITMDMLIEQHGIEKIMSATQGNIPTTANDLQKLAAQLEA